MTWPSYSGSVIAGIATVALAAAATASATSAHTTSRRERVMGGRILMRGALAQQHPSRQRSGRLPLRPHRLAVDGDPDDSLGELPRLLEGRAVDHRRRVEEHEVGLHPGRDLSAIREAHAARRQRRHLADRLLEREELLLAHE